MVALIVSLKLRLLRNSLRRSVWRVVGMILAAVYALGLVAGAVAGLVALRLAAADVAADVTRIAFSTLTLGWLLMSVLIFGVDETVDPARFAVLPVRARELLPGLLVAALIGVPGVSTVLVALSLLITWSRSPALLAAAVLSIGLGVLTCVLMSRAATSALASFLQSRRFRDLAALGIAMLAAAFAVGSNLLLPAVGESADGLRATAALAADVAGWTPFGWAWALPADVVDRAWGMAATHLVLASALVAVLWVAWQHFLGEHLVGPATAASGNLHVKRSGWVDRLYPGTPAGGVAARSLRYWRRDPRYLAAGAGFLIGPLVLIVLQAVRPEQIGSTALLAPLLIGSMVGLSVAQDLSYDGSALWVHVSAGVSGREDRVGRALAASTVFVPLTLAVLVLALALSGRWDLTLEAVGLTACLVLGGIGVGSLVGTLWQWPAPPPGANPFQTGNAGGLPAALSFFATTLGTGVVALPAAGLAVWGWFTPWVGWLVLPVGLLCGGAALLAGLHNGGQLLDRRWSAVLSAVSERSG